MSRLAPVGRRLLRDAAYEAIRDAIVSGELAPGQTIRDGDLAERLGLSKAPVRDAITRLVDEGLVESQPQRWTRVTPLEVDDVSAAAAVVRAMHELVVRAGVPRLTREDVAAMRAANERFAAAVRDGDLDAATAADDELHGVLVTAAGNRAAAATIARYTPLIRRLEHQRFATVDGSSVALHRRLIAACGRGDVEAAVELTTRIWAALEALADRTS